jgi:cytochrome c2
MAFLQKLQEQPRYALCALRVAALLHGDTVGETHDVDQSRRIALAVLSCVVLIGCDLSESATGEDARTIAGGNPARGQAILAAGSHGCAGCHTIPGVRAARGVVGPPLDGMARRSFIAGQLPNEPEVMLAFLQDPPALLPQTAMPNVLLSLQQARDIAAYLYTLEPSNAR